MSNKPLFEVRILRHERINEQVRLLWLPKLSSFKAGQMVSISIAPDSSQRLYSICSGEKDSELGILYDIKRDGFLTPKLDELLAGNSLWVSAPFGSFTDFVKGSWFLASGTGIAPFYSLFRTNPAFVGKLVHGGRDESSFYFMNELTETLGENYIRCSSRGIVKDTFHGRVTEWLQMAQLADAATKYYLCGSAEMVVETRDVLISRGVDYDKIISEIYF